MCSAERQVTEQAPPVFLVHALDDGVSCANSRLMEQACREKGVTASLQFYPTGGHGYGMEKRGHPTVSYTHLTCATNLLTNIRKMER